MNEPPVRIRILSAWRTDTEVLTAGVAMERAHTTDVHAFLGTADRGEIVKQPWRPHTENLWKITPKGLNERDRHAPVKSLVYG